MKKYFKITILLLVVLLISSVCFAAEPVAKGDATMVLVEDKVNSMTFGQYGEFEKKMVQIDTENKTIDIRLTAKNNQPTLENLSADIVLLIDSSRSMSTNNVVVDRETLKRKQLVLNAASQLIDQLLDTHENIKIGVVEFATSTVLSEEGTAKDAKVITPTLTDDSATLKSALQTVSNDTMGARTDIEVGLETAETLLATSNNSNKYIVVLTDAIPNTSKGVVSDPYTEKSADPTKAKLVDLGNKGVNVISMLINISNDNIPVSGRPEDAKFKTYKEVAEYVFGTVLAPTTGSVYYVTDEQVTNTVTQNIYDELIPVNEYKLTNIVIKDYFPKNIIDNFDFAVLTQPDIGEVTAEVDKTTNSITWTISELEPGEVATFTYRLTLKDTFSSEIVGLNLPTNEDVTIDYEENGVPGDQKHNDKSPVVALDVPAPKEIPQTGSNVAIISGSLVAIAVVIATVSFIVFKKIKLQ